ncbi:MAG: hypothetical protein ACXACI_16095 [Candidatus Hodarchaeales archaeon]|jgi:hypothetical protein
MEHHNVHKLDAIPHEANSTESIESTQKRKLSYCLINFGDILSAEPLDDLVLIIKLSDSEVRLDLSRSQLAELLAIDEQELKKRHYGLFRLAGYPDTSDIRNERMKSSILNSENDKNDF